MVMAGILLIALLIPLLAVVLDSPPARALASRLEREGGDGPDAGPRVAALEAEVQRLADEVRRLEEETDFLHRLLEERPPPPHLPAGDSPEGG
ncbi:MAG: hypothetical protein ABFS34_03180 [Gemmatimonadota bacterium]